PRTGLTDPPRDPADNRLGESSLAGSLAGQPDRITNAGGALEPRIEQDERSGLLAQHRQLYRHLDGDCSTQAEPSERVRSIWLDPSNGVHVVRGDFDQRRRGRIPVVKPSSAQPVA